MKRDKIQFVLEQVIGLTFVLVMMSVVFLNIESITDIDTWIIFGLVFLTLSTVAVFGVLKRQGKWFKHKDYVPKAINFVVILAAAFIISGVGNLQIDRWFVFVPVAALVLLSCVNYYLNFREKELE